VVGVLVWSVVCCCSRQGHSYSVPLRGLGCWLELEVGHGSGGQKMGMVGMLNLVFKPLRTRLLAAVVVGVGAGSDWGVETWKRFSRANRGFGVVVGLGMGVGVEA